jgi:hypothetical protein
MDKSFLTLEYTWIVGARGFDILRCPLDFPEKGFLNTLSSISFFKYNHHYTGALLMYL